MKTIKVSRRTWDSLTEQERVVFQTLAVKNDIPTVKAFIRAMRKGGMAWDGGFRAKQYGILHVWHGPGRPNDWYPIFGAEIGGAA